MYKVSLLAGLGQSQSKLTKTTTGLSCIRKTSIYIKYCLLMLAEECAPDPVESVEAREQKIVKSSPIVSSYKSKISSNRFPKTHLQPCKYFHAKRVCPFGCSCRYSHSNVPDLSGDYVSDCRAQAVEPTPKTDVQNRRKSDTVCYHYLKSACRYGSQCVYRHPLKLSGPEKFQGNSSRHGKKERVPSERNLGSFLISSGTRPSVRPKSQKSLKPFSADLREVSYI